MNDKWEPSGHNSASAAVVPARLVTGGEADHFLPHLCAAINAACEIDMAVAFVKSTGLRLLLPDLLDALTRSDETAATREPVRLRIITSDYLDIKSRTDHLSRPSSLPQP